MLEGKHKRRRRHQLRPYQFHCRKKTLRQQVDPAKLQLHYYSMHKDYKQFYQRLALPQERGKDHSQ